MGAVGIFLGVGQQIAIVVIVAVENAVAVGITVVLVETGILGRVGVLVGVDHAVAIGILR